MGTRHYQKVINKEGEVKIRQYGQWDGYPDGQGVDILNHLRDISDTESFLNELNKIPIITQKQIDQVNQSEDWKSEYPYLSRDCGSDIIPMIGNGIVKFVQHTSEQEAEHWCEGFYEINFHEDKFKVKYHDYEKTYKLSKLPTEKKFLKDWNDFQGEEN